MKDRPKQFLKWVAVVGPTMGAIVTVAWGVMDIYSKYRSVSGKANAGYETLAPAVRETQDILVSTQEIVSEQSSKMSDLYLEVDELDDRLDRCEAYMEILSNQRRLPKPPPVVKDKPMPTAVMADLPPPKPIRKPKRAIPDTIDEAKQFQRTRAELRCDDADPLCGAVE